VVEYWLSLPMSFQMHGQKYPNPFFHLTKTTWQHVGARRNSLVLTYVLFVIANLIHLSQPWVLGTILNTLQAGGPDMLRKVLLLILLYNSLPFFFWVFHGTARVIENLTAFEVVRNFQEKLFATVTSLPLAWHKDHHSGDTIDRSRKAADGLRDFADTNFENISMIARFVVSVTAIVLLSPWVGLITLIGGGLVLLVTLAFNKPLVEGYQQVNQHDHKIAAAIHDYITNMTTVITLRLEKLAQQAVHRRIMAKLPIFRRVTILNEWKWFSVSMALALLNFLLMAAYLLLNVRDGAPLQIGNFAMLYQYIGQLESVFFGLAWRYQDMIKQSTDMRTTEPIFAAIKQQPAKEKPPALTHWKRITISQLHFAYEDEDNQTRHLENVSLSLRRGQKIALVGESGSGKSTLLVLLRGLLQADRVQVDVDGEIFQRLDVLSGISTLIPQEPEIFENTIGYNITAGVARRGEEIDIATELARFDSVLARLPHGYETSIKEKGVNLSGGEKQRLALARGIFAASESSLILLDEPTSSVDPTNERQIYENLFRHFASRCIISSIHKLHLLPLFDWIYLIDNGRIVEQGGLESMLQQNGRFARLWAEIEQK